MSLMLREEIMVSTTKPEGESPFMMRLWSGKQLRVTFKVRKSYFCNIRWHPPRRVLVGTGHWLPNPQHATVDFL